MSGAKDADNPVVQAAELAGEWVEALGAASRGVIAAEMQALAHLADAAAESAEAKAARQKAQEVATEEGFDNLPL
jgi:hypothetical protein